MKRRFSGGLVREDPKNLGPVIVFKGGPTPYWEPHGRDSLYYRLHYLA